MFAVPPTDRKSSSPPRADYRVAMGVPIAEYLNESLQSVTGSVHDRLTPVTGQVALRKPAIPSRSSGIGRAIEGGRTWWAHLAFTHKQRVALTRGEDLVANVSLTAMAATHRLFRRRP